eukprot:s1449_g13.t1
MWLCDALSGGNAGNVSGGPSLKQLQLTTPHVERICGGAAWTMPWRNPFGTLKNGVSKQKHSKVGGDNMTTIVRPDLVNLRCGWTQLAETHTAKVCVLIMP